MEPPGPPAPGDGRLAAGASAGRKTECQQYPLDYDHVDPGAVRRPGPTWLRFQRPAR